MLPPSEGKRRPGRGRRLELEDLSFPELGAKREELIDAVVAAAGSPEVATTFGVSVGQLAAVAGNADLPSLPTARAGEIYDGVLYQALDLPGLDAGGKRRAGRSVLISSALFGVLRLGDRIPPYKLSMGAKLPGVGPLAKYWRVALATALSGREFAGLLVDCRSGSYAAAWRPDSPAWVQVLVPGATHRAKHTRGLVAHALCAAAQQPRKPADLADLLTGDFDVDLQLPERPGAPWRLSVTAP